ncbi:MAG: hypothetical protein WCT50_01795 [Patescibacteria group bacterium]
MLSSQEQIEIDHRKRILEPIVFFDLFDYPLTAYEVWKYLNREIELLETISLLKKLVSKEVINEKNGFYFLFGREEIVEIRQKRYNYSCAKIKIAKRFGRLFALLPYVKVVAIANFLGDHNLREDGDIDFFIITSAHRIWLSRFFCTGLTKLLNKRPTAKRKKDRICLSFYISEEHLNISDLASASQAPYWYYYLRGFMPIYDKDDNYSKFLIANGISQGEFKGNILVDNISRWLLVDWLEMGAKKLQLKIMPTALKLAINNSDGVYVSDDVLKLHLNDKRRYFSEKFNSKINEIF